jgi:riboflavin kinase/FMN adenylyltransferase
VRDTAVPGVASVGVRPTVTSNGRPLAEVYLLDFDASIYGRRITIEFLYKLRDEARFADLAALTRQIERDVADARGYFARGTAGSPVALARSTT